MVINVGALRGGDRGFVESDIPRCRRKPPMHTCTIVKVIIETSAAYGCGKKFLRANSAQDRRARISSRRPRVSCKSGPQLWRRYLP